VTPRRVAVLAPMTSELAPLRAPLRLRPAEGGLFAGACGSVAVVAAVAGVGTAAAARAAERVLAAGSVDHVFVVGVAGGIGSTAPVGALVAPERVLDVATGAFHHPTRIGVIPARGVLATADGILAPGAIARLADRGAIAVDMETSAVAAVCGARGLPWSVFRGISDRADDGGTDDAIFALLGADGRPNLPAVARFLVTRPHRIPQLVRLGIGTHRAARAAADALLQALRSGDLGADAR
jgi:adenosylhomocysteine nucleosidase